MIALTKMSTTTKSVQRVIMAVLALVLLAASFAIPARADRFDEQINAIEQEVTGYQAEAGRLRAEANTLQNALNAITAEKNTIISQIKLNEAELAKLNDEIVKTEQRIANQKTALSRNLRSAYLESSISPLEMVASSRSISDYVDKQEYRNQIRDRVQQNLVEVRELKIELAEQKKAVEQKLVDQNRQREVLASKEAEQANLLAQTQGQEAAYQNIIGQKNSQVASLRAQQASANRSSLGGSVVAGDPGRGGYPDAWHNAPQDSVLDSWGMYNRECVSYTAWKVHQAGKRMPYWGGRGNANQWPDSARADGIATGSTPREKSVAISMNGFYGHAMWVESVNGDTIRVSQYNYGIRGEYSEMTISGSGLIYIYF